MAKKPQRSESPDKVGESDGASSPMENFKQLTRGLLTVSRAELQSEQKRYQDSRSDKSVKKTTGSIGSSSRKRK